MNPYYQGKLATIYHGDCRELSLENISAIVTDPPYGLGFMGKEWDQLDKHTSPLANDSYPKSRNARGMRYAESDGNAMQAFHYDWATLTRQACLSGAPLLSFGGTRTFHRLACAIEDAGWEIRDTIMWVYGSGFPKSLDIGKAVDKLLGNERTVFDRRDVGHDITNNAYKDAKPERRIMDITKGNTVWEGYGTALKPAYEPIILAMNPLDGTFAENALKHKVAGLNIDGCRIATEDKSQRNHHGVVYEGVAEGYKRPNKSSYTHKTDWQMQQEGRFPANFIHDGSQLVLELFPEREGKDNFRHSATSIFGSEGKIYQYNGESKSSYGSAARFFYCAKASKAERDAGLEAMPDIEGAHVNQSGRRYGGGNREHWLDPYKRPLVKNNHPTVKPLALMEYLVKLVKMPEYNLILDPFMGSGTTLLACIKLGIPCIGIDNDEHTCEIAARRCENALPESLNSFKNIPQYTFTVDSFAPPCYNLCRVS